MAIGAFDSDAFDPDAFDPDAFDFGDEPFATVSASLTPANIVLGGQEIVITLTNETWVASGATFDAQRQAIIDGLDSAQSEATGWNAEVRDKEVVTAVVRTSDTVVTITLTASSAYAVTANEAITVTVPSTAVSGGEAIVASPVLTVSIPAASGGHKVQAFKYVVEVDNQFIGVNTIEDARRVLSNAETLAQDAATADVQSGPVTPPKISVTSKGPVPRSLRRQATNTQRAVTATYEQAKREIEHMVSPVIARKRQQEDEDAAIRALML